MTAPTEATPEAPEENLGTPTGWRGPIAPLNAWSGDGRWLALEDGAEMQVRPLPQPFKAQIADAPGHDNSVVVGLTDTVWLEDGMVWGEGPFDLHDEVARDWADKLGRGFAGWVSLDPSDVTIEEVLIDPDGNEITPDMIPDDPDAPEEAWPVVAEIRQRYSTWKFAGATLVSSPAFETAKVEPTWDVYPDGAEDAQAALTAAAGVQTGAMIALVPSDPGVFAVDGGDPADEMHLTLAYLGEAIDWTPEARTELMDAVMGVAAEPVDAAAMGFAILNPAGTEPATVHLVGDAPGLEPLRLAIRDVLDSTPGLPTIPEQHDPFLPHITAGYGVPVTDLTYTGPVVFDRLRIAFAGVAADIMLGADALAAAGQHTWSWAAFHQPEPDEYTTLTVTEDGRVFGHLGQWGVCHNGIGSSCVTIPPSPTGYRKFHRKPIPTDRGQIEAGILTMDTSHPSVDPRAGLSSAAVVRHYDHTGKFVAMVRAVDGRVGPWLSGQVAPWCDPMDAVKLGHCFVSGDWRGGGGAPKDLRAVLAVNVEGFSEKSRAVAASGADTEALVAAGIPVDALRRRHQPQPAVSEDQVRGAVRSLFAEIFEERERDQRLRGVDQSMKQVRVENAERRLGM